MNVVVNQDALGLAAYQAVLGAVGVVILVWLSWRAVRAVVARTKSNKRLSEREVLAVAWPPVAWATVLIVTGVIFSTLQAYGPRVALPPTKLEINAQESGDGVRDLSPKTLTDAERLAEQRRLEAETKARVNLK